MSNYFLIPLGLAAEVTGAVLLVNSEQTLAAALQYAASHALACCAFTAALLVFLPRRYRRTRFQSALFLFSLQFAIPVIGIVGVYSGVLLALYLPRFAREVPWQTLDSPELPYKPLDLDSLTTYTEGGLRQVLREATDSDKRLKALLATRQMVGPVPVELLRSALKDPVDDVRLLAYSMLEQREQRLLSEAGQLQEQLKKPDSDRHHKSVQRRLAHIWWEMVYLGLAQGGLRRYYLEQAQHLLLELSRNYDRHQDWLLLGRVELERGHTDQAGAAFEMALQKGCAPEAAYPYLAEVAFSARDFDRVRHFLGLYPPGPVHPGVAPVLEGWLS